METWTTEPGMQLYTSPLGDQPANDKFGFYCFETQHYPDSVNQPDFPTTILRPGETFRSTTEYRFSVK
jgi:aldose 1-epimerase